MALLSIYSQTKLICALILLAIMLIGNVRTQQINDKADTEEKVEIKTPAMLGTPKEQKSIKKELRVDKPPNTHEAADSLPIEHGNATAIVNSPKSIKSEGKQNDKINLQKETVKAFISESITTTTKLPALVHHYHHEEQEFVLNDKEDFSNSLTTSFYFFLALSSGAVIFILFKIYRLRLSRAERKYGVQGDRSNQELTPLPISIEDGHSDDEEQIVFEVQRQNIRIL